jgi:hypothetical protein
MNSDIKKNHIKVVALTNSQKNLTKLVSPFCIQLAKEGLAKFGKFNIKKIIKYWQ